MSKNRSSIRFIVLGFAIIAISALSVAAENAWGGNIFGSIEEFFRLASTSSTAGTAGERNSDDAAAASNGKILFTRSVTGIAKVFIVDPTNIGSETCLGMCIDANDSRDGQNAAWSPDGTTIAFTRLGEIWLMNADGSNQRRIVAGGVTGDSATFSSNGTKIAFTKICASCGNQFLKDIWMMNADGTGQTQLTNATHGDSNPSWQPGGTTIAFTRQFANGAQIYTVTTSNTENQLTSVVNANSKNARWSPDGTKLVFESDRDTGFGARPDIYVMNAQGSNVQRITNDNFDDHNPTFSPDGSMIAWLSGSRPETSNNKLFVMNAADGSNQHLITIGTGGDGFTTPSWGPGPTPTSSNGPIIFQRGFAAAFDVPYNRGGQLYKVDPTTQAETLFGNGSQPNYSFDGSKIVFTLNSQLSKTSAASYNPTVLTVLGGSPISGSLYPKWSPDGANIAYNTTTAAGATGPYHVMIIDGNCTACDTLQSAHELNVGGTSTYLYPSWHPTVGASGTSRTAKLIFVRTSATKPNVDTGNYTGDVFSEDVTIASNGTVTEGSRLNLTNSLAKYAFPTYSHDGTKIAFVKTDANGSDSLFVMNANGSNAAAILNNGGSGQIIVRHPAWSPDDTKIAIGDSIQLFQITTDSQHQISQVTSPMNAAADLFPSWAPIIGNPNPVPAINSDGTGLSPSTVVTGGPAFTLTVNGTNFVNSSTVNFNGVSRTTTFVSATKLTSQILASDIGTDGTFPITVVNPAPGGGTSNAVNFTVSPMAISFDGRLRDRVSKSESGLCFNTAAPPAHGMTSPICDGDTDGTFSLVLSFNSFSKSITKLDLVGQNGNRWDTVPGNGNWVVGLTRSIDAPFENGNDGSLNLVPVGNLGTFKLFVPDSNPSSFVQGKTFSLTITFSDSSTLTASTTVQQTPTWDMGIGMRGPSTTMIVGDRFSYSVSLQNYGTALATNLHFTDQLPSNVKLVGLEPLSICPNQSVVGTVGPLVTCNFNQLDPGQATTIVLTVQAISAATNFSNTASVSAQVFEPIPDPHPNTVSVQSSIVRPTDLAVTINGPTQINSVDLINYTVDLVNKSNPGQDAFGVVFTADIPSNATFDSTTSAALGCAGAGTTFSCNLPFAVGAGATLHINFALRPLHTSEAAIIKTPVHVTSTNPDSNLLNNDAVSPETAVKLGSDLAITMTAPTQVGNGSNLTYAIRVTNNGPSLNSGAVVVDQMPANTDFVSVTPGPGSNPQCGLNLLPKPDPSGPDYVQCSLGPIPVGTTYQINLTVRPRISGTIFNVARVGLPSAFIADIFGVLAPLFVNADDLDGNPTNNDAGFSTQTCVAGNGAVPTFQVPNPAVVAPAGLKYTYRVRALDTQGGRISYSFAQGPQGATLTNMGDGTSLIQWTPDSSLIGTSVPFTVVASILAPDGSPLCNGSASKTFQVTVTQPPPPGGYCIINGAVKICSDAIVPVAGPNSLLAKKMSSGELKPQDYPTGNYQLGGNTMLGNYLLFTGTASAFVDRSAATIKITLSGGSLILKGVPIIGDQTLWSGDTMNFTFDADGNLTQFLQGQADQLHISGCTIHITAAHLLLTDPNDLGIEITGQLILPDVAGIKNLHASFQSLRIQQRSGVHFTGQINMPDFKIGAFGVQDVSLNFVASPDGMHDIFTGGGTLITPALTVAGNVQFVGGQLDSFCASVSFPTSGVPIPPIFNLSGGGFGVAGLRGGPVPRFLCGLDTSAYSIPQGFSMFLVADITIANPAIANIIRLSHAGLIYTAPNRIALISDLDILTARAATAAIGIEIPYNVSIGAQVSILDNYKVFDLGGRTLPDRTRAPLFAAGLHDDGAGHLIGFMSASAEARVQIPAMPNPPLPQPGPFIYGLAHAAGVRFPLVVARLSVGFDYPPGAFSADVTFPVIDTVNIVVKTVGNGVVTDIGTKFGSLPPITFAPGATYVNKEQTARSAKNAGGPQYYPGNEGLHVMQSTVAAPLTLGSYTVSANTPKLAFDLSAGPGPVRYDLIKPDSGVITPDNAASNNATFLQNADLNESYYVVNNPAAGTWIVQAEDGSQGPFVLNAFGANAPPVMTSVSATQTGNIVQINYNATDPDDNAPVSLFYSKSSTDFTGTPIVDGLPKGTSGSYNWNTGVGSVPAGDYYVFAMISDGKNVPQTKFATTKITVVDALAPATPQGVLVKPTAGNSLAVSWTPNTETTLQGYEILYDVDLGAGTVLNKLFDPGVQTNVRLPMLANNTPYRVSVVAYSQTSTPDPNHPGSNIVTSHMSAPSPVQIATTGMATPPMVHIASPNGGELIRGNNDVTINWSLAQDGDVVNQKIEVSTDDGATYTPIIQTLDKTARNYVWHAPTTLQAASARVRVTALDSSGNTGSDTSDAGFVIIPTPAPLVTVSGRVTASDGRGLRNTTVSITDSGGGVHTATTSSFGFFSFGNVAAGEIYVFRVSSRLFRFTPRTVQINDNVTLPDFVGLE